MLTTLLRVLVAERAAAGAKQAVARSLRNAVLLALAGLLVFAAAVFGLITAYMGLRSVYAPVEAAGLMAAVLALAGLALLALRAFLAARARSAKASRATPGPSAAPLGRDAEEVGHALGPVKLVALALAFGIAAGRNLSRS